MTTRAQIASNWAYIARLNSFAPRDRKLFCNFSARRNCELNEKEWDSSNGKEEV